MSHRDWQEPLENQLGDLLVPVIPNDLSSIQFEIELIDDGLVVATFSPEIEQYVNAPIPISGIESIHKLFSEFINRNLDLSKCNILIFWNGDQWQMKINYFYKND